MSELKFDPKNARKHGQRNKDLIRRSLEEVGAGRSILVDGDNIIRAGNGVYEQAMNVGLKVRVVEAEPDELIAVKRGDLTGKAAERAALFDNRAAETSEWEEDVLADIARDDPELLDGLWSPGELDAMIGISDDSVKQSLASQFVVPPFSVLDARQGLPIRVGRQFRAGRKLGKTHQNVLVFFNGDPGVIKGKYAIPGVESVKQ